MCFFLHLRYDHNEAISSTTGNWGNLDNDLVIYLAGLKKLENIFYETRD